MAAPNAWVSCHWRTSPKMLQEQTSAKFCRKSQWQAWPHPTSDDTLSNQNSAIQGGEEMAQAKQAQEKDDQGNLESNRQTQTPPSRQAGNNQPQGMSRRDSSPDRRLSRSDQFSTWSPFSLLDSFRTEMDRLFDDFGLGPGMS